MDKAKIIIAISQLEAAVENLLPGAKYLAADIGLINNALLAAAKLRKELEDGK